MAKPKKSPAESQERTTTIPITRAAAVGSYYANHTGISVSPWDITLRFGRILPGQSPSIEEGLFVYMSPQHAKAFLLLMQEQVGVYESTYGPLTLPPRTAGGIVDG
jgi:hypothetical protein